MAPVIQSYESQDVINVSQDAHTSPTSQDSVVEDSLDVTGKGGPVQQIPQNHAELDQEHDEDDEDLYDATPPKRGALDTAPPSTKNTAQAAPEVASKPTHARKPTAEPMRNEALAIIAGSAVDELAENSTRAQRRQGGKERLVDRASQEGAEGQFQLPTLNGAADFS